MAATPRSQIALSLLSISICVCLPKAQGHEKHTPVIIDTDMALDDVRAIVLMLNSPHTEVKAMVTSDGSSSPDAGAVNLMHVLGELDHARVPVGRGRKLNAPAPAWREQSETLGWTCPAPTPSSAELVALSDAVSVIRDATANSTGEVVYVCLGPLTNLADALKAMPDLPQRLRNVYVYGAAPGASSDWNQRRDPEAFRAVALAKWNVYALAPPANLTATFDAQLLGDIDSLKTPGAALLTRIHADPRIQKLIREKHLRIWDEVIALFLENPRLGRIRVSNTKPPVYQLVEWDREKARREYLACLAETGELSARQPVTLASFPTTPSLFQPDVAPLVARIIVQHGEEEWKAVFLTNELHRHLGIYSIMGAKMGIRARELLGAGLDQVRVVSHAGCAPPLSCMNDGFQASTGASLGRGTISIADASDGPRTPAASFSRGERCIRLQLKEDLVKRIRTDVQRAVKQYGNLTPTYFDEIRRLSLVYWRDRHRNGICDETWEPEGL